MKNPTRINQGGAHDQRQPPQKTGRRPTDDFPTDGEMSRRRGEKMRQQEKAEGERRD
jgi:hypothetical protein